MTPEEVRAIRKRFGLTQAGAAKAVGVSARTWHSWELPRDNPNARTPGGLARTTLRLLNPKTPPAQRRQDAVDRASA